MPEDQKLHIAMFPWLALGHITGYLHISNKLAQRGHMISFFIPNNTKLKFESFNLHPTLIDLIPLPVPHVVGLPPGAETTSEVPSRLFSQLATAMDSMEPAVETALIHLKPHIVFFDFASWLPALCRRLGIKSIYYSTVSTVPASYMLGCEPKILDKSFTAADLLEPPPGFPPSGIKLSKYEARTLVAQALIEFGKGVTFAERLLTSFRECDVVGFKSCREMAGPYCDYVENILKKLVILGGPIVPENPTHDLEERWENFLNNFGAKTIIYCALGSECILEKNQFQELLLGFELTGFPFLVVLKPPEGAETLESALPEGFAGRVKGRGLVHGGWVQQQLILKHPAIGCFVTHCGAASLSEALVNECQIVMLPILGDQVHNARLMSADLRVGVEIGRGEEDGLFNREGVCEAVRDVMDLESGVGKEVATNHAKWKEFLLREGLEDGYINDFINKLQGLLGWFPFYAKCDIS